MRDCFGKTKLFFTLYFLVFFPRVSACGLRGSSHLVSELVINEPLVVTLFNERRLTAGGLFRALVAVACSRYLLTYLLEVCSLKLQTNV